MPGSGPPLAGPGDGPAGALPPPEPRRTTLGAMSEQSPSHEAGWLLLLRATHVNALSDSVAPGSVVILAACGHRAFISPSGLAHYEGDGRGLYTVCTDCVAVKAMLTDPDQKQYMLRGSAAEIREWKGVGEYDQAMAWAQQFGIKILG